MPTTRSQSTPKPRRTAAPRAGAARPRPAAATTRRPTPAIRRRKPEPESNAKKVLGAVTSALPGLLEKAGTPAKKAKPASRTKGAGLALGVAGAGFAAFKQRAKKQQGTHVPPATPPAPSVAPAQANGLAATPPVNGTTTA